MSEKTLIANVRPADGDTGTLIVASPVVGRAHGVPEVGVFLNAFAPISRMEILHESHTLRLPREVQGTVAEIFLPQALTPVAYNEPLFRLDPRLPSTGSGGSSRRARGTSAPQEDAAAAGTIVVTSPSEGIFYRGASPDAPPFVSEGTQIANGGVLGLVEVMKCFNQITYGGPGYPERVEITKILVHDAAEVQFGQPLFWVRPSR
ncbi:MAG TPA: biotin/lipoyl-containing protein [Candidatus Krumholzibacteria bacterium]|nr:biotin/lipoyl-containing protein [Candidatus Krumholzibacteria bacterium]